MVYLATAVLKHESSDGSHFDWMVCDPNRVNGRLWTVRMMVPTGLWEAAGKFNVRQIDPHRRVYLQYQGPIGGGRGTVIRVDQGQMHPWIWGKDRRILALSLGHFKGTVHLDRVYGDLWQASASAVKNIR